MKRNLLYLVLSGVFTLSSCQYSGTSQSGVFAVRIDWPPSAFTVAAIPTDTDSILLEVYGSDATKPEVTESFSRSEANKSRRYSLNIGRKKLIAKALDENGKTLAEARSSLEILPNQLTQAELELKPTSEEPINQNTGSSNTSPGSASEPSASPGTEPNPHPEPNPGGLDDQTPESPVDSSPAPQEPSASPFDPSQGGGSGDAPGIPGVNTVKPVLSALSVDPSELSGAGYVTRLKIDLTKVNATLRASDLEWFCEDSAGTVCDAPISDENDLHLAYWTAPTPADQGPYTLRLKLGSKTEQVVVTVLQGNGTIGSVDSNFEGE